jgi:hypothetical protein
MVIFLIRLLGCGYRRVSIGGCLRVFGEGGIRGGWGVLVGGRRVRVLVLVSWVSCPIYGYYSILNYYNLDPPTSITQ